MDRMFHYASHKRIGILLKQAKASLLAEVNFFAAINRAAITSRVFKPAAAGGFILWLILNLILRFHIN